MGVGAALAAQQGSLALSDNGTTLSGTIDAGLGGTSQVYDELVIYIDSKPGGYGTTATFTDTGGGGDSLRRGISGYDGSHRATLNFSPSFGADYAIALSPTAGNFGAVFTLDNAGNFTYGTDGTNGSANLTPVGSAGPYTFSIPLSDIGSPTSFNFATTYLNAHSDAFRSNEAFGNSISDTTTPANAGNPGYDTALAGSNAYITSLGAPGVVPEPGTVAAGLLLIGGVFVKERRRLKGMVRLFTARKS